ncbi:hypothetical protein TbgDal_X15130 [Trypanosoma brucei gambiense DAL972]|uniref:Uncharacterized protein n=1 Tax=Trypanosoma brucei gambiense (strain MHOM/CI/86/DAL972) TaxID=679716 RepID=D0A570_TRYB9|nr:hypothetical protein TbgDal_X15130 [Trypanosoma brucei gambiense DAL972]CBH16414.1 hypothetical protein TbgDal_X15130 [Trypanosoma brucei gambiense DAL972]|eukprot:XP_011778678.1 hypothetical protein TbgDal_X15130 [Trypanosoma brucei gambiense DAL972]
MNEHPCGCWILGGTLHIRILKTRRFLPFFLAGAPYDIGTGIDNGRATNNYLSKARSFSLSHPLTVLECIFPHALTAVLFNTLLSAMNEKQPFPLWGRFHAHQANNRCYSNIRFFSHHQHILLPVGEVELRIVSESVDNPFFSLFFENKNLRGFSVRTPYKLFFMLYRRWTSFNNYKSFPLFSGASSHCL